MIAVRCPCCLHRWEAPPDALRLTCPVCGAEDVVPTPAAAVETGFSLPLSSGTSVGAGCEPASVEGPHPFLGPPQGPGEIGRLGRYRVLRTLGRGGMGVVFEAEDERLKRKVALKVMRPEAATDAEGRARFLREAEVAAGLDHEHIVAVFDLGEENGAPFLVLPLLRGETLEARLKRERPLPLAEALRIGREMAEGLAAAHEVGLVHRDVKPGNVWLAAPQAWVRLLDFGLVRLVEGEASMTKTGAVLGTPAYMSPEQAAGGKGVDARADLFSLGAVLYEMLTGRRAFRGDNWMEVLANRLRFKPPTPHEADAAVPEEVSALVMRLLAEEPAGRPSSARQVARQLRALEAPPAESLHLSRQGRRQGTLRRRRWVVAALAVGLLLPLGLALRPWLWSEGTQGPPTRLDPTTPTTPTTPAEVSASAAAFAEAWHGAARDGLVPVRAARDGAARAFADGWYGGAGAELLVRHQERQHVRAAGPAFADGWHGGASLELAARHQDRLVELDRRLRAEIAGRAALSFAAACSDGAATPQLLERLRVRRLYERGMRLLRGPEGERDPKAAAGLLRQAAEAGHAPAQYQMGWLHVGGYDAVPLDQAEAVLWWGRAAEKDDLFAGALLGRCYGAGMYGLRQDQEEAALRLRPALPRLRQAAHEGHPEAQFLLGALTEGGIVVRRDEAEAARWYLKAAEQGHPVAQHNLGGLFADGRGVTRDDAEAARWDLRAAEQGHAASQANLALMYENGRGVAKDFAKAVFWYRKAAEQGDGMAQNNLGWMYHNGRGVPRDTDEAARLYRKVLANPQASEEYRRVARQNLRDLGR
jgi:TPR repeat protein/serine/threonine protein kinase